MDGLGNDKRLPAVKYKQLAMHELMVNKPLFSFLAWFLAIMRGRLFRKSVGHTSFEVGASKFVWVTFCLNSALLWVVVGL